MAEKGKKMYSKGYVLAQANEIAKKAGLDGVFLAGPPKNLNEEEYAQFMDRFKKEINKTLIHIKNVKGAKGETIELNKKQLCAGIQYFRMMYYHLLPYLNPDSEKAVDILKIVKVCDQTIKGLWQQMSEESINVSLKIPDLDEDQEE